MAGWDISPLHDDQLIPLKFLTCNHLADVDYDYLNLTTKLSKSNFYSTIGWERRKRLFSLEIFWMND